MGILGISEFYTNLTFSRAYLVKIPIRFFGRKFTLRGIFCTNK